AARAMKDGSSPLGSSMPETSLWCTVPGVGTTFDGDTAVMLIPSDCAISCASPCVNRSSAALVAPYMVPPRTVLSSYGPRPGPIAEPELIFTIAPERRGIMSFRTSFDSMNGPCTFTAKQRTQRLVG